MDTASYGTAFYSYYGLDCADPDAQPALITLTGANAGVRGMRILWPLNRRPDYVNTVYTIRVTASGVYCVNCCISASGNGVDFRGCDGHFIYTSVQP